MMIDGVIRLAPSQLTPLHGFANVLPARPDLVARAETSELERAVVLGRRVSTVFESRKRLTVTPGIPSSSCSTTPGSPPPGLKSRQTTPVIAPADGSGSTACVAPAGTSDSADRREAEQRRVARRELPRRGRSGP